VTVYPRKMVSNGAEALLGPRPVQVEYVPAAGALKGFGPSLGRVITMSHHQPELRVERSCTAGHSEQMGGA
jgi:hypothetical protein